LARSLKKKAKKKIRLFPNLFFFFFEKKKNLKIWKRVFKKWETPVEKKKKNTFPFWKIFDFFFFFFFVSDFSKLNLTIREIRHVFNGMNSSPSLELTKKQFKIDVKKDIPVPLGSVVNIRNILYGTLERHLSTFTGEKRTEIPHPEGTLVFFFFFFLST